MLSHQDTFEVTDWETVNPKRKSSSEDSLASNWYFSHSSDFLTAYKCKTTIDDIKIRIDVSTPQDGTWSISAMVQVDPRGRGFIARLTKGYESRSAARNAAIKLILGLNCEQMIRQFILGHAKFYDVERTIPAVKEALTQ